MRKSNAIIIIVILIVVALAAALLVGHKSNPPASNSSSSSQMSMSTKPNSSSGQTTSPSSTTSVSIQDFAFTPADIKVKVGDTVTWTNEDSVGHTVTADTLSSDAPNSQLLAKGQTYKFTFTKAGTYKYHCSVHPNMTGTVTVE